LQPTPTQRLSALIWLAIVISGCASESATLNSERIAHKFGNYGLEVLESSNNIRVTNLYSEGPGGTVCRTFAVVGFVDQADPAFEAEHTLVVKGGSIGAIFKSRGWQIEKDHQFIGDMKIGPRASRLAELMRIQLPTTVAVHVYVMVVSKNGVSFDYAMITEVHHPDYLTSSQLQSIYGKDYSGAKNRRSILQVIALVRSKFADPEI
jgi:hypothetical protein